MFRLSVRHMLNLCSPVHMFIIKPPLAGGQDLGEGQAGCQFQLSYLNGWLWGGSSRSKKNLVSATQWTAAQSWLPKKFFSEIDETVFIYFISLFICVYLSLWTFFSMYLIFMLVVVFIFYILFCLSFSWSFIPYLSLHFYCRYA